MAGAQKGRAMVLKVTDGTSPVTYATIAGLKSNSIAINNEQVDITNKDSAGWRELLESAGTRTFSMQAAGVFKGDTEEALIRGFSLDGTINSMRLYFEDGYYFEGDFQVASLEYTGEYNGARQYSIKLEGSGVLSYSNV